MKPFKAGILYHSPLVFKIKSRTRQQTAHFQTILALMQGEILKLRVIVMLNSDQWFLATVTKPGAL